MKSARLVGVVLWAIVVMLSLVLGILYVKSVPIDDRNHSQILLDIAKLQKMNAQVNESVFANHLGVTQYSDQIVSSDLTLRKSNEEFYSELPEELQFALETSWIAYTDLVQQKSVLLENFQSLTAADKTRIGELLQSLHLIQSGTALEALLNNYLALHDAQRSEYEKYSDAIFYLASALLLTIAFILFRLQASSLYQKKLLAELNFQQFALDQHSIVSIADATGTITYANDKLCRISGYTAEELSNQHSRIPQAADFENIRRSIVQGKVWQGELKNQRRDSSYFWTTSTVVPFLDEKGIPFQYVSIGNDISYRKKVEEELIASNAFLASITESMGEGVYVVDSTGECVLLNPKAELLFGWSLAELAGKTIHDVVLGMDSSPGDTAIEILGDRTFSSESISFVHKSGRVFPASLVAEPWRKEEGIVGHVIVFQDISERVQTARNLAQAKEGAERANQAKSEFLANMSHEIRTPMNAVVGLSAIALGEELDDRARNFLTKISCSASSLLAIIDDMLDFAKIEAGELGLDKVPFSLNDIVAQVSSIAYLSAREKGLDLYFHLAPDLPHTLIGDPVRLGQVITNMINNATKFTHRGAIIFRARPGKREPGQITLAFEVEDTGIGIAPEDKAKLFEPFSQADTSSSREHGGTGLGLSICKRLVEAMGGTIELLSEPEQGSTFSFSAVFGLSQDDSAAMAVVAEHPQRRALILEGRQVTRDLFESMLRDVNIVSTFSNSSVTLLDELDIASQSDQHFDFLILNTQMSRVDCKGLLIRIEQNSEISPKPKIILQSDYDGSGLSLLMDTALTIDVLENPLNSVALFESVSETDGVLPGEAQKNAETNLPQTQEFAALQGARVLLAEDNPVNQLVAREMLRGYGLELTMVDNGKEALEALAGSAFDLILMDIQMPVMDGYAATAEIRANPEYDALPIVAMTAHAMAEERDRCLQAGMNDHLSKPVDRELLLQTLGKWLSR